MVTLQEMVDVQRDRVLDLLSEGKESFGVVGAVCVPLPAGDGPQLLVQNESVFWGTLTTAVMVVPLDGSVYVLTMDRGFPADPPSLAIATIMRLRLVPWPVDALTTLVTNACGFFHVDPVSSENMARSLRASFERERFNPARPVQPVLGICDHPNQPTSTRPFCNCPPSCVCRRATCPAIDGYYPRDTWADSTPPVGPTRRRPLRFDQPQYVSCPRCGQANLHPANPHADQHCAYCRAHLTPPVQRDELMPSPWAVDPHPWVPRRPGCPRCGAEGYDITTGGCGACGAPF